MKFRTIKHIALTIPVFGLLYSCKVAKQYERPQTKIDSLFRNVTLAQDSSIAKLMWHEFFKDPKLKVLIQEGIENNNDLKTAVLQIVEANASLRQAKLAYYPTVNGGVQITQSKQSKASLNFPSEMADQFKLKTTTYQASISASWEWNVWGQLNSLKRQSLARFLKSEAYKRAVQTRVVADIATYYYNLLALDKQLAITEETVKNRISDVETMRKLKQSAVVNGAAVVQSEANRYAVEVTIPDLKQSILETENALGILLGRMPGHIERNKLEDSEISGEMATGVPAELLGNRPDIEEAEMEFRSAFENVNVAKSYFYPTISITAESGLSTLSLKNFFNNSLFYNLLGGVTQPIFNKGQNKARYRIAEAQKWEAFNNYQQKILSAGKEVSDALSSYKNAIDKKVIREKQIASSSQAVEFTTALLQYSSTTNYTDVLSSQQGLLSAQLNSVSDRLQELQAAVNLYCSLGGGWR